MVDFYFGILNALFAPVLVLPPILAEMVIAAVIAFIITIFYKKMVNQSELKELKEEQRKLQEKVKELQKTNPDEANRLTKEMLKLTNKQMKMNFKPMLPTLLLVIILFPWIASVFMSSEHLLRAMLPFTLPFFGNDFGWLMWYIVVSIPFSQIFRKLLGVQ
ncbi:MAG: EMC3/TMCO1 family protein [Candidatus Aenigmatarchaeota archaeon]